MKAHAIEHLAPRRAVWREIDIDGPSVGEVLVHAECSAISAGTESLVFRGDFPAEIALDTGIAALRGDFAYPVRYGYALVGQVVQVGVATDRAWLGRRVFLFHPHQDFVCVPIDACWPVPDDVTSRAALFLPNTESAVNFVMDARPVLGERFLIVGLGVLGLLTTALLARFPLAELVASDPLAARRECASGLGAIACGSLAGLAADGHPAGAGFDAAIEVSGSMEALDEVLAAMGFGGRVVVGSWYGRKQGTIDLGGVFHRRRLSLVSSQVSTIAAGLSARWNQSRRLDLAWEWVRRISPATWITHTFPPDRCQQAFELAACPSDGVLQIVFLY